MPGPAHLIYGFTLGLIFWKMSSGRFSHRHVFIYGVNTYFGPDIGAVIWFATRNLLNAEQEAIIIYLFHNPYTFPLVLAIPLAFAYRYFSRIDLERGNGKFNLKIKSRPELSFIQCYLLISAGGFSHFFYDFIFDANGQSSTFRWVIDTGYMGMPQEAWIDAGIIIVVVLMAFLLIGYMMINGTHNPAPPTQKLRQSTILVISVTALYVIYLSIRLAIWPEIPAIGEEADLGVVIFAAGFIFLPMGLCVTSMHPLDSDSVSEKRKE